MREGDPDAGPRVDVVIPTYEHRDVVLACLRALDDPVIARRVVVDDVSADDTLAAVATHEPTAVLVALREHRGLAHALNAGAAAGDAPFVLFLNDDVVADPGAVARLLAALEEAPDVSMAGGRLVDPVTAATQTSYLPRGLPGLAAILVRLAGIERLWRSNPWSGAHLRAPLPEDGVTRAVRQPAGACLLVRRADLTAVGGWDERYWFWYEDVDLAARLLTRGAALYEPAAVFRHLGRHSTRAWQKPAQHARLYHGTLQYTTLHLAGARRTTALLAVLTVCLLRLPGLALRRRRAAAGVYLGLARQAAGALRGRALGPPVGLVPRRRGPAGPV